MTLMYRYFLRPGLASLGLLVLGALVQVAGRSEPNPESVRIVVPGVWFREGDIDLGRCNNIIIEMKDYLIVVDANLPGGARAALADVRRISRKPVKYVFVTHHHGDHVYGNAIWMQAGATTLAFQGVADELKRLEPGRWRESAKNRADVAEENADGPQGPTQIITESLFVLNDGRRKVEFRHFGWGHTRGDGFVYLPKEQVLCTGDAVVNGPYNYLKDADAANWPAVIHAAEKLKVKYLLPGHGLPGGRELLSGQALFLTELYKAVKTGVEQGKKPEDIQGSLSLPDSVSPWVSEGSLRDQVRDIYSGLIAAH